MSDTPTHPPVLRWLIVINALAYGITLLLLTWTNLVNESRSPVSWAVQCLPLLLVLPGMLLGRYRAYSWLGFILILYFIPTVVVIMTQETTWGHSLLLLLIVVMFITAPLASRLLQRHPATPTDVSPEQEDDHE